MKKIILTLALLFPIAACADLTHQRASQLQASPVVVTAKAKDQNPCTKNPIYILGDSHGVGIALNDKCYINWAKSGRNTRAKELKEQVRLIPAGANVAISIGHNDWWKSAETFANIEQLLSALAQKGARVAYIPPPCTFHPTGDRTERIRAYMTRWEEGDVRFFDLMQYEKDCLTMHNSPDAIHYRPETYAKARKGLVKFFKAWEDEIYE